MSRFFIEDIGAPGATVAVEGDDAVHIRNVLRLKAGDRVTLCDGGGREGEAVIRSFGPNKAILELIGVRENAAEPKHSVTLYQCLPKAGKMELVIQKCVELGIAAIAPVQSARCVVKLEQKDVAKKIERYRRIALEAAKQSQRGAIPKVNEPVPIGKIDPGMHDLMIVAYEEETFPLKEVLRANKDALDIGLLIGPEGGLERSEVDRLVSLGAKTASLGKRILRTETAGMATLAMILYELEG
ncbi:MAG: RsmE family RNA methyltransferase [Bacillota bacterium]